MINKILIKIIFSYFLLKLAFGYDKAIVNDDYQGVIKKDKISVFYQRSPYDRAIYFNKIYKKGNNYFIFFFACDEDYIGAVFVNKLNILKNTISTVFKKENNIISNGKIVAGGFNKPVYSIIDENNFYITFLDNIWDTFAGDAGEKNYFIYQVKNNKLKKVLHTPYEPLLIPYKNYIYTFAKDKKETYLIKFSNDFDLIEAKNYKKLISLYLKYSICNDNLYIINENKICKINLDNYETMLIKEKRKLTDIWVKDDKVYYLSLCQKKADNEKIEDLSSSKKYTFCLNIIENLQKKYSFKLPIRLSNPNFYFLSNNFFLIVDSEKYEDNNGASDQLIIAKLKLIANKKLLIDKTYKIKYKISSNYLVGSLELSMIANELIITYDGWIPGEKGFVAFIPIDYLFSINNLFIIDMPLSYGKLGISPYSYPIKNPVLASSSISNINYELFIPEDTTIEIPQKIIIEK